MVGDDGFTILMGEIITAVAYKLPIKIVIIKNNSLGQIKWEQMVFQGNPEDQCDLLPIDFVALAQSVPTVFASTIPGQRVLSSMKPLPYPGRSSSRQSSISSQRCCLQRLLPTRRANSLKPLQKGSPIA